jgi:hypothetical protein
MGVAYLKGKSFYLIEPFVLYAGPVLLFGSFPGKYSKQAVCQKIIKVN